MAVSAYEVISTQTLGTAASSVTFSSIPQTYTDLVLVVNHSTTGSNPSIVARFNSDTASNYSRTRIAGDGSVTNSGRGSSETTLGLSTYVGSSSTAIGTMICNILNYANSTTYKTCITRNNAASHGTEASVTLWRSTSAITTFLVSVDSSSFATGSTFTLYGVKAAA
jgi:hypothetical protein